MEQLPVTMLLRHTLFVQAAVEAIVSSVTIPILSTGDP